MEKSYKRFAFGNQLFMALQRFVNKQLKRVGEAPRVKEAGNLFGQFRDGADDVGALSVVA